MSYEQAILDVTWASACCGIYTLACFSFGASILRLFRLITITPIPISGAAHLGGTFLLGQGLFGAIWQTVATLGYFSIRIVLLLLLIALLSGLACLPNILRLIVSRLYVVVKDTKALGPFWVILALLLVVLVAIFALLTLHPPAVDGLAYYLPQAKLIAAVGQYTPLAEFEHFSLFGINSEMHAATMYLIGGEIAGEYSAKMYTWVTALAGAATLWAISSKVALGRRGQLITILMLYTTTCFTLVMWDGKVDLFGACLALVSVYWILQIGKIKDWLALFLCGLTVGLAINSKASLLVVMIPMLTTLAFWVIWTDKSQTYSQKNSPLAKQKLQRVFWGALIAASGVTLAFLPLFFKNGILFGEPLAVPFSIINSEAHAESVELMRGQVWYSPSVTRWIVMTYPFALIFGQYPMQYGNVSPLLLAFLPLLFIFPRHLSPIKNQSLMLLTLSSILGILAWVILYPSVLAPRYILTPLLTLLPLGGYTVEQLWRTRGKLSSLLKTSVIFASIFMIFATIFNFQGSLHLAHTYWLASSRTYSDPRWKTLRLLNENAPQGATVYLAMWYRLPLRADLLENLIRAPHPNPMLRVQREKWKEFFNQNVWEALHHLGATWLVFDKMTHENLFKGKDLNIKPDFLSVETYPIDDNFVVYQIVPKTADQNLSQSVSYPEDPGIVKSPGKSFRAEPMEKGQEKSGIEK